MGVSLNSLHLGNWVSYSIVRMPDNRSFIEPALYTVYFRTLLLCALVHSHATKEPGQYPAMLTSSSVNDPYVKLHSGTNLPPLKLTCARLIYQLCNGETVHVQHRLWWHV